MYRSWSRDRSIGGKMLKLITLTFITLFTFSAFACWKAEGSFAVDGETYKFSQKVEHEKEYKFPGGNFILSFTLKPMNKKINLIRYKIEEKKNMKLVLVTLGDEEISADRSNDIFAKGEEGQPNSIITIKLNKI